jgi:hypothetical protein
LQPQIIDPKKAAKFVIPRTDGSGLPEAISLKRGGGEMGSYRIYFCDGRGRIFAAENFDAIDDEDAIKRATALTNGKPPPIFELWQRDRLVHRHSADGVQDSEGSGAARSE